MFPVTSSSCSSWRVGSPSQSPSVATAKALVAAVHADLRFHRALLVAAHNDLMLPMEAVIEAGLRARDRLVHDDDAAADPIPMHRKVVAAVRDRDPDGAEEAMRELLAQAERDVRRVLRRRQQAGGEPK